MKYFSGTIAEKKITDFQKYDASIKKFDDRLELVLDLLNDDHGEIHDFISTYFADYYTVSPSQNGYLAEQDAVCKTLELLGTYLLNAKDIQSNRRVVYRFWKSKREFNNYKESQNINTSTLEAGLEEGVEVIDMFASPNDKNYRLDDNQRLYAKDIREIKEIANLQDGIDTMKQESFVKSVEKHIDEILPIIEDESDRATLRRVRRNVENYVDRWASDMSDNQILIKESIKRPIRFRNTSSSNGKDITNSIELDDVGVVKGLITHYEKIDLTSDIGLLIEELDKVLSEITTLKKDELDVIELFRKGYSREAIVKEFGIKQYTMTRIIDRFSKKIVEHYINQKVVF